MGIISLLMTICYVLGDWILVEHMLAGVLILWGQEWGAGKEEIRKEVCWEQNGKDKTHSPMDTELSASRTQGCGFAFW